jgi:hypothetical protein
MPPVFGIGCTPFATELALQSLPHRQVLPVIPIFNIANAVGLPFVDKTVSTQI